MLHPIRSYSHVTLGGFIAAVMLAGPATVEPALAAAPPKTPEAWTFEQARQALAVDPNDVYLQYVMLQLGRNEDRLDEATDLFQRRNRGWRGGPQREVNLFGLFTGALAVQETLQLEAMRFGPLKELTPGEIAARRNSLNNDDAPSLMRGFEYEAMAAGCRALFEQRVALKARA